MRTEAWARDRSSPGASSGQTGRSKSGPRGLVGSAVAPPAETHAGQGLQTFEESPVVGAGLVPAAVLLHVEEDRSHQHAVGVEARVDRAQALVAPDQQGGAGEQDDGQRHLRHHQGVARGLPARPRGGAGGDAQRDPAPGSTRARRQA